MGLISFFSFFIKKIDTWYENKFIISEKLDIKKMTHNNHLSKTILDTSFSKICNMLEWKSKIKGKYYYQIDTYFPIGIRRWECSKCHFISDRDINANINILFEWLEIFFNKI